MWKAALVLLALARVAYAEDVVDDGTTKGAVPIPTGDLDPTITINHRDTTVTFDELPKLGAKWKQRKSVAYKGVVPIAVHHCCFHVNLTFVGPVNSESGYPGSLKRFPLVPSDDGGPYSNSFPGFSSDRTKPGPILTAFRVLPSTNGDSSKPRPESERRQVVVYMPKGNKRVILVATKLLTDTEWTPLLRVDVPKATRIDLIDPGWH